MTDKTEERDMAARKHTCSLEPQSCLELLISSVARWGWGRQAKDVLRIRERGYYGRATAT